MYYIEKEETDEHSIREIVAKIRLTKNTWNDIEENTKNTNP